LNKQIKKKTASSSLKLPNKLEKKRERKREREKEKKGKRKTIKTIKEQRQKLG
jgi:hypothetical protein